MPKILPSIIRHERCARVRKERRDDDVHAQQCRAVLPARVARSANKRVQCSRAMIRQLASCRYAAWRASAFERILRRAMRFMMP